MNLIGLIGGSTALLGIFAFQIVSMISAENERLRKATAIIGLCFFFPGVVLTGIYFIIVFISCLII